MNYIANNKLVTIIYEMRINSPHGEIVEKITRTDPLTFVYSSGKILKGFEVKLHGLGKGDTFRFVLKSKDAYGARDENAIIYVSKERLKLNGTIEKGLLSKGNSIPMSDDKGNEFEGIVLDVKENMVKMDLNHPLTDKDLFFQGEVIDILDLCDIEEKEEIFEKQELD